MFGEITFSRTDNYCKALILTLDYRKLDCSRLSASDTLSTKPHTWLHRNFVTGQDCPRLHTTCLPQFLTSFSSFVAVCVYVDFLGKLDLAALPAQHSTGHANTTGSFTRHTETVTSKEQFTWSIACHVSASMIKQCNIHIDFTAWLHRRPASLCSVDTKSPKSAEKTSQVIEQV